MVDSHNSSQNNLSALSAIHKPVLFDECVELVTAHAEASARADGRDVPVVVDCTLG